MTRAAFAKHQGVSRAAVTQWAAAGRVVLTTDGKIDVERSVERLAQSINTRGGKRRKGQTGTVTEPSAPGEQATVHKFMGGATLTDARRDQAAATAERTNIEVAKMKGELVEHKRIIAALSDGLAPIVSQLDSMSARLAPKLIGLTEVRQARDVVDDEVERVRQEIADTLRAMAASPGATKQ